MIITCPECRKKYKFDEAKFGDRIALKFQCKECQTLFSVKNPTLAHEVQTVLRHKNPFMEVQASEEEEKLKGMNGRVLELPKNLRISVAVIDGDDEGKIFRIDKPRVIIGRKQADIVLQDLEVSRKHCAVEVCGYDIFLKDLGSSNGTYVDGKPIQSVKVYNKMEFRVGSTTLMFIISDAEMFPFLEEYEKEGG